MLLLGDREIDLCLFDAYGTLFDVSAAAADACSTPTAPSLTYPLRRQKNNRKSARSGRRSLLSGEPSRSNIRG